MGKLDIKEVRGAWRDARREDTEVASEQRPRPVSGEHLRERPASRPRTPHTPDQLMKALGAAPARGVRDLFGIVGTTQAETFRIDNVVAHGGFSVIYKAQHLKLGGPVALKCLQIPPTAEELDREEFLVKFKKEGELMFRLSSVCSEVVRPLQLDAFRLKDGQLVPFIVLEWLDGHTLKDAIIERLEQGKKPLSVPRAMAMLAPVARVLSRAHDFPSKEGRLAILHCDLKPDNIFVAQQEGKEVIKVFDFGIAKVREAATREAGEATRHTGRNMFTPAYAAPEQWSPDEYGQTGAWTDVFALALTLTEVVTQRPAVVGTVPKMLATCLDKSTRPSPRTLGLVLEDAVEEVFVKALAVDPRDRTRSVVEFWGQLEDALGLPRSLEASGPVSLPSIDSKPQVPSFQLPDLEVRDSGPVPVEEDEPFVPPSSLTREKVQPPAPEASSDPDPQTPAAPHEVATPSPPLPAPVVVPVAVPTSKRKPAPQMRFDWLAVALAACAVVVAGKYVANIELPVLWICLPLLALGALAVLLSKGR